MYNYVSISVRYCTRLLWCGVGPLKATYRLAARQVIDGPMRRRPAISQVRYWLQWHSTLPLAVGYKGRVSPVCNMHSRGDTHVMTVLFEEWVYPRTLVYCLSSYL